MTGRERYVREQPPEAVASHLRPVSDEPHALPARKRARRLCRLRRVAPPSLRRVNPDQANALRFRPIRTWSVSPSIMRQVAATAPRRGQRAGGRSQLARTGYRSESPVLRRDTKYEPKKAIATTPMATRMFAVGVPLIPDHAVNYFVRTRFGTSRRRGERA